jgi:hypothetical protein
MNNNLQQVYNFVSILNFILTLTSHDNKIYKLLFKIILYILNEIVISILVI